MVWKNWAGNVTSNPSKILTANNTSDIADVVNEASSKNKKIRMVGTGHSFAPICATDDVLLSLSDKKECSVSDDGIAKFWAGSVIGSVGPSLWEKGYALANQGDIDVQRFAGALSTGTHGTGVKFGSFSSQVKALKLVAANGVVNDLNIEKDPDLIRAAALSVGMLGILDEISLQVVPQYYLKEQSKIIEVDYCFDSFKGLSDTHRNIEFYWLPGFEKCVIKTLDETDNTVIEDDGSELPPMGTVERYLRPTKANRSYLVYPSIRTVPFLEMEYAVPFDAGIECVSEIRKLMQRKFPEFTMVVEYRTQEADNLMLSPTFERPAATISVHDKTGDTRSEAYFRACEEIFMAYEGRPHWAKLCYLKPHQRADLFPEFENFSRIRQKFDPDGMFLNDVLKPLFD